ncbi:YceI family protein [Lacisediminimonas profundi]|uniref:YceI family protein n=1 Tax=Lacisediminimonas profundi TaxID=2603856 RepID=UPI00124B9F36|nr:YceI family protein [Lacisediminimonas profundi]
MKRLTLAIAMLATLDVAAAAEYKNVQADKSSIGFAYKQMGVAMDGRFRKFTPQLSFDPARPANGKVSIDIDLGSVDTGTAEADQEVAGKAWFNTKAFPTARFVSSSVKSLGGNKYEVAGKLSIKGQARDLVFPTTFTPAGNSGLFEGGFTIRRGDFSIGEGAWSKFDIVANDIQIKFRVAANSQ